MGVLTTNCTEAAKPPRPCKPKLAWRQRAAGTTIGLRLRTLIPTASCSLKKPFGSAGKACLPRQHGQTCPATDIAKRKIVEAAQSPQGSDVNRTTARTITHLLRSCVAYQFHDTSNSSRFKTRWDTEDNDALRSDGANLAAILYRLERNDHHRFELICRHIGRVLPVFDRFMIEDSFGKVQLRWKAKGTDKTFGAHLTSDGSLRVFALVTLLNLPRELLPHVVLLDEPELGLHPTSIALVGEMIKALAVDVQVIVATQSPLLVDVFDLEEIVVFEANDGRTSCRRLATEDHRRWLDQDYSLGELWQKNLIGGRP